MEAVKAVEQHQDNDQRKQRVVVEGLCKVKPQQRQKGPCHAASGAGDAEEKGKRAVIEQEEDENKDSKLQHHLD